MNWQNKHKYLRFSLFICIITLNYIDGFSQKSTVLLDETYDKLTWLTFVNKLENEFPVHFYFVADSMPDIKMTCLKYPVSLEEMLNQNLKRRKIQFTIEGNMVFVTHTQTLGNKLPDDFFIDKNVIKQLADSIEAKRTQDFLSTTKEQPAQSVIVGTKGKNAAKKNAIFTGRITDIKEHKPIEGATLYFVELSKGTTTNETGNFSITVPKGKYTLVVNSIENKESRYELRVLSDGFAELVMEPEVYSLQEVVIRSDKEDLLKGTNTGFEKITAKSLKQIPAVMGERDIIKVALLLPGVQSVGEGSSGFNVRGAPSDQNMFYINKVPVYNTSHILGFFSAFNPDIVDDFTLYKGSIPTNYGGRLSAIFNINSKQGNLENFSARGGISPITARLMLETTIIKKKLSVLVGARSTYSDWALKMVQNPEIKNSQAAFVDFVSNINYNINDKNQLNIFGYYSEDNIKIVDKTKFDYSNKGASLSYFHAFNKNNNLNLSIAHSEYSFNEINTETTINAYTQSYAIQHDELNLNFTFRPNEKHTITTGLNSILYGLNNNPFLPYGDSSLVYPKQLENEKGLENGLYINDEWKVLPTLTINGGLRFNTFTNLGPKTVYTYESDLPISDVTVSDTLNFGKNEPTKTYTGLDYRLSGTYQLNPEMSVKLSYNRIHQNIFMLSNTIALSPTDKWKLADYNIKPMVGDQISLGYYSVFNRGKFEASSEIYYKNVDNLVEFKDGANLLVSEYPEQELVQGNLKAYGIELMLKKPQGKFNGWINYTYARSTILVNNEITGENVNFGLRYPANYDKPHSVNFVANIKLNKRISFSGNIVYSTGRPITYPTAIYYQNGQQFLHYSKRNEYRIPDYFRTDLSFVLEGNLRKNKVIHGSWIFSVYNVTGRKNAYSVYFEAIEGVIKSYRLSIFGAPIFSLTYDFKLGNYAK
jgi:hypothetical protein